MAKGPAAYLRELSAVAAELAAAESVTARLGARRDRLMVRAREAGAAPSRIAEAAGVSAARVSQVAPAPARPAVLEPVPDEPVTRVPDGPIMSGSASRRRAESGVSARPTVHVDLVTGHAAGASGTAFVLGGKCGSGGEGTTTLAEVLDLATLASDAPRVRVYVTAWGTSSRESVRAWAGEPVERWTPGRHWTDKGQAVFRYRHESGREVEVTEAWWPGVEPVDAARAWDVLGVLLAREFGPAGVLMTTPATTGRHLWSLTIGPRTEYATLAEPVRRLISATSGQGRMELRPAPEGRRELHGFTYLDGRFMYASLIYGMPVGEARRVTEPGESGDELGRRGRWLATVTVPEGWAHVGILGRRESDGSWTYPAEPGTSWQTWADAVELRLALAHGWGVELTEGLVWDREGKPLTEWRDRLVSIWTEAGERGDELGRLVARAVRSIVLYGIGAFAAGAGAVERVVDVVPEDWAGAVWPTDDGRYRIVGAGTATPWQDAMAHPEWAATIWARARVALLDHALPSGGRGGALHEPAANVIAFRTDALFLAGPVRDADDDGRPGRFRVKGTLPGGRWPETLTDLFTLRDESESL